jgi:inner membrane protein
MASLAHVVVGLAGGRAARRDVAIPWREMAAFVALSMLADADVIAFALGIPYAAPFGHRGATHSILFALLAGLAAAGAMARGAALPFARTAAIACLVAISHPLLDALTDGGFGVALLWPFSNARFFAPWRPIPVAPIGARFFSPRGLRVAVFELGWSMPLLLWALWPRRDGRVQSSSRS